MLSERQSTYGPQISTRHCLQTTVPFKANLRTLVPASSYLYANHSCYSITPHAPPYLPRYPTQAIDVSAPPPPCYGLRTKESKKIRTTIVSPLSTILQPYISFLHTYSSISLFLSILSLTMCTVFSCIYGEDSLYLGRKDDAESGRYLLKNIFSPVSCTVLRRVAFLYLFFSRLVSF